MTNAPWIAEGRPMTRAERLGTLLDLARLRSADLLRLAGRLEHALALLDWLQEEAQEAAGEDQRVCGEVEEQFADLAGQEAQA